MKFKMLYASSYDRGLQYLLEMWPDIKKRIPEAELHIAYGWNLFDIARGNDPEGMKWKAYMVELMKQEGITEHGRLSKKELNKLTAECDILSYYCNFSETNCITAINSIKHGAIPITMDRAGLQDTAFVGTRITSHAEDPEAKEKYLEALVYAYENPKWLEEQREEGKKKISDFYWVNIASKWVEHFK